MQRLAKSAVGFSSAPYRLRTAGLSPLRSNNSGTLNCIRAAISRLWMRAARRESPGERAMCRAFNFANTARLAASLAVLMCLAVLGGNR